MEPEESTDAAQEQDAPELRRPEEGPAPTEETAEVFPPGEGRPAKKRRSLGAWVGTKAKKVVDSLYEARADDIEQRARRAVGSAYRDSADDIQGRAIEAIRRAITLESDRIREAIEHGVQVKKREMRLSLLVLVTASLLYLLLYWLTHSGTPAA